MIFFVRIFINFNKVIYVLFKPGMSVYNIYFAEKKIVYNLKNFYYLINLEKII